ncbi:MAG: hypothetical protein HY854_13460 [Burkholderiales bacterium]|nr:hypothetical protein [Burkholderiales bacterium]
MAKTCIKCGYVRRETDTGPDYACPACGVVYAKAEAAAAARPPPPRPVQAQPPPAIADDAKARADALVQQFALAQAAGGRKASPYRGMALVALVAFSMGFASAAGLYSGAAKFSKKAAVEKCVK